MDQETLIEAIGSHLDALENILNAIILIAVAVAWAGIRRRGEIEAVGITIERRHAFHAVAALYCIANVAALILFLRIGDLVTLVEVEHFPKALTTLTTHQWVLNPFSYFGPSGIAQIYSGEGLGLLIVVWWLCNGSLYTLLDEKFSRAGGSLLGVFTVIGLFSIFAIYRTYMIVLDRTSDFAPVLHDQLLETAVERTAGTFLGIIVGGVGALAMNRIQAGLQSSDSARPSEPAPPR